MLLSKDEFDELKLDDTVEVAGLFPPLTKEPLVLRVAERTVDKIDCVVTYFGVTLGRWRATQDQGTVKWQFLRR